VIAIVVANVNEGKGSCHLRMTYESFYCVVVSQSSGLAGHSCSMSSGDFAPSMNSLIYGSHGVAVSSLTLSMSTSITTTATYREGRCEKHGEPKIFFGQPLSNQMHFYNVIYENEKIILDG
jgi:hypothetical protein